MTSPAPSESRLRITEIFLSLQGESATVGWPTVFIRLTGCPLRCGYCDTEYAFTGGQWWTLSQILDQAQSYGTKHVTVTGGEPLAQKACLDLLTALCDAGYTVSLETSGAMDVSQVDPRVVKVLDIKTPGSGEQDKNRLENLDHLSSRDQVKFVLCDRADFDWAKEFIEQHRLADKGVEIFFSPSYGQLSERTLAEWILQEGLAVRFQIQLHKHLWGDVPGH